MAIKTTEFQKEGYFKNTPKKIKKLAIAIKGFTAALAALSYFMIHAEAALVVGIIGAAADEIIKFYTEE